MGSNKSITKYYFAHSLADIPRTDIRVPLCTYECSRSYYGNELISNGMVGHDVDTVTCFTRARISSHPPLIPNASPVTTVCALRRHLIHK